MSRLLLCLRVGAFCVSLVAFATAQSEKPLSADRILPLTQSAGIIFRGTVISVERVAPTRQNQLESMQICFRVAENLRGTKTGSTLCIREWAGLWTSRDRYRPGQQLGLFLYPPSQLGLTSPVGGNEGCFEIEQSRPLSGSLTANRLTSDTSSQNNLQQPTRDAISSSEFRRLVRRSLQQRTED